MPKFHVSHDGTPGICRAEIKDCPIGGEHYDSKTEAAAAYEESMIANITPPVRTRSIVPQNAEYTDAEINSISNARKSDDQNLLLAIVERGPSKLLKTIAGNPYAEAEVLLKAREKAAANDAKTIYDIEKHKNFPSELISEASMEKMKYVKDRTTQLMRNPKITDEQAMIALDNGYHVERILESENNLSDETITALVESSYSTFTEFSGHPQYNLAARINEPVNRERVALIAESSSDANALRNIKDVTSLHPYLANNARAPMDVLEHVSKTSKDPEVHSNLYKNRSANDFIKENAVKFSSDAVALSKFKELEDSFGDRFEDLVDSAQRVNVGEDGVEFRFPPEEVRNIGLDPAHMGLFAEKYYHQKIENPYYDTETGILFGLRAE